jgi:spore coat polysaccharide biosynthesis predicted glycosyltransferase SpsG
MIPPVIEWTQKVQLKVLFISRGSARDGLGHVIRSRTLAKAMSQVASVRMVVIGDRYVENLLTGRNLDYEIVADSAEALERFRAFPPHVVIFDLMQFDENHFAVISDVARTASLSPIFNCLAQVDLIFHRTAIEGAAWSFNGSKSTVRAGLDYAIISEACQPIPTEGYARNIAHETLSVAISMGGTDAANKTLQVVNTLKQLPDHLLLWVFLGEGYSHSYEDLVSTIRGSNHEIILAKTNDSMWRILDTCVLAILAGGTTTYEACYARLPSINTLETRDHFFLIQELVERGTCLCAGSTFKESLDSLCSIVQRVNWNRDELMTMHQSSASLIDGLAVKRIIEEVYRLCAGQGKTKIE